MNPEYWLKRWADNHIGFHLGDVNPALVRFADRLLGGGVRRTFVPLCGKSVDLAWLAARGQEVVGVELAAAAIEAFHREQGLEAVVAEDGAFRVHRSPGLTVYEGDFFALGPKAVGPCDAIWDRAALVSWPATARRRYAQRLLTFLRPGGRMLLVTVSYDQARADGPPFSVDEAEVRELFGGTGAIETLAVQRVPANPKFREKGLDHLVEAVYLLEKTS